MSEENALTEEFNASAAKYMHPDNGYKKTVSLDMLLLKYTALQRYKLDETCNKKEITETFYRCATDTIKKYVDKEASRQNAIPAGVPADVKRIFDLIIGEGEACHIPATAPQELSSLALDMLRRMEGLNQKAFLDFRDNVDHDNLAAYRANATALAAFSLEYADKLRNALKESLGNVTTSQPVAPSKTIQLKEPANG